MRPITVLLALASSATAINIRIGSTACKTNAPGDFRHCQPVIYVFGDDWERKDGGPMPSGWELPLTEKTPVRFCENLIPGPCPVQTSYAGYGLRVAKDDGARNGNLWLETWHNHNGQTIGRDGWCVKLWQDDVTEDGNQMFWQCSFPNY
jgi:hypothetical protein